MSSVRGLGGLAYLGAFVLLTLLFIGVNSYNDDLGLLKWNPTWFSSARYSAPIGFRASSYGNDGGMYKRFNENRPMYKWSPVYLSNKYWKRSGFYDGFQQGQFDANEWQPNPHESEGTLYKK